MKRRYAGVLLRGSHDHELKEQKAPGGCARWAGFLLCQFWPEKTEAESLRNSLNSKEAAWPAKPGGATPEPTGEAWEKRGAAPWLCDCSFIPAAPIILETGPSSDLHAHEFFFFLVFLPLQHPHPQVQKQRIRWKKNVIRLAEHESHDSRVWVSAMTGYKHSSFTKMGDFIHIKSAVWINLWLNKRVFFLFTSALSGTQADLWVNGHTSNLEIPKWLHYGQAWRICIPKGEDERVHPHKLYIIYAREKWFMNKII